MARVVLAMSGGVDSSASAWLLKEQGHEVIGLFMRSGATEETVCHTSSENEGTVAHQHELGLLRELPVVTTKAHKQGCCSATDAADARRVADTLDIPFHALNFQESFSRIKDYFADEYLAGRTPNPCVMCNIWLKFGRLWEFARQIGADAIASGHYARIGQTRGIEDRGTGDREPRTGNRGTVASEFEDAPSPGPRSSVPGPPLNSEYGLFRGRDLDKDQSYVLFGIRRELLDRILYPVGERTKSEIRELARKAGIQTADKPDSQEICFIPDNDYARFLEKYRGPQSTAGEFVDTAGRILGHHEGIQRFTIGQRRGLGVTFGEPRFVVRIEPETNRVVIGTKEELGQQTLEADRLNWLIPSVPQRFRCLAQIRSQHTAAACDVEILEDDRLRVTFDEPQFGIAPGQAVVLYADDQVLGGGWIRQTAR